MTTQRGSAVKHAVISATDFGNLSEKDENTIYFVGNTYGMNLYKGAVKIAGDKDTVSNIPGFAVKDSNPSNTTGMVEGVLYLAPNGKLYYKNGNNLGIAFDLVQSSTSSGASNATQVPSITAMYAAISAEISSYMSGTFHSNILAPVADITALKAVASKQDKDVVFVESVNAIFSYDAQSSATANDTTVVTPTSGGGRWLKTQAGFAYSSTDFTWGASGLELNTRIPANGVIPLLVDTLPTASASTVGQLYVLTADNKMYLGIGAGSDTGTLTTEFNAMTQANGYIGPTDYADGTYTYDSNSGTGDSRVWVGELEEASAATYNKILYSNGAWRVAVPPGGEYVATAASGSNPWDEGLVWTFDDGTGPATLPGSPNHVVNSSTSYSFVPIAGAASGEASSTLMNTVATNPTVTASNNGEVYYNTTDNRVYVVESGALVQKSYSKADVDGAIADAIQWYDLSNNS